LYVNSFCPYPVLIVCSFLDRVVLEATFLLQNVGMTNSPFSSESWLRCGALPFEHEQEHEHEQERGEPISQQALAKVETAVRAWLKL
jgi:hypothetical protein